MGVCQDSLFASFTDDELSDDVAKARSIAVFDYV